MGGVTGQNVNLGLDGLALAVQVDIPIRLLRVLLNGPSGGPGGLVPDKQDVILGLVDPFFEVVDDATAGAHAAAGNDDGRSLGLA